MTIDDGAYFSRKLATTTIKKINVMKHLLAALLICMGSALFAQSNSNVDVTISGQTSREQLAQMRKDLLTQGIVFNYAPQFDNERRLMSVQYKFSTSDNVLIGQGSHEALQQAGANVLIHVNPGTKFFAEEKNVAPHK
jgi:hypothetical protein